MLLLPELLWENLHATFRATRRKVEQIAYLDGFEMEAVRIVTTIAIPCGVLEKTSYRVSAEAMSQAGKHLRRHGLVRLAQVHTHPGAWVGHSDEDDRRAYSQEVGAISIVVPDYGRRQTTMANVGFHVRQADGWRRAEEGELSTLFSLLPSTLDFRR